MSQETKIPASGRIEGIYLAAGHSYFGRHGKDAATFPMVAASEAECIAGKGLFGDRFFEHKSAYKGQVTFSPSKSTSALRRPCLGPMEVPRSFAATSSPPELI